MLTTKDQSSFWSYANPKQYVFPPEWWLAIKDIKEPDSIRYRALDLMLERHGCIDAPLP